MTRASIRERLAQSAVSDCDHDGPWCSHMTEYVTRKTRVPLLSHAPADIAALLAVADAAAEVAQLLPADRCAGCGRWYERALLTHADDCPAYRLYAALAELEATK